MKISEIVKLTAEHNKKLTAKTSGDVGLIEVEVGDTLEFYDYSFCIDGVVIDSWENIEDIEWE